MLSFPASCGRVAALALTLTLASSAPARANDPFSPSSAWSARLSDSAPLAPGSAGLVAELRRQAERPGGLWINTDAYSVPVYTVGPDQPTVRVIADDGHPPLVEMWAQVPLPPDAVPAAGSDGHLVVHQPSTDTLWEFWALRREADGWHARWGGRMDDVSRNPGYFAAPYGATATGLALLGGLIRADEMAAGVIPHALAVGIPDVKQGEFVWPAQRGDGTSWSPEAIPEGTRFRLNPHLDLGTLGLTPAARAIAQALQDYGLIVRDRAGAVVLYGEDPRPLGGDPWPGLLNEWPDKLLATLPWAELQVVVPDQRAFAEVVPGAPAGPAAEPLPEPTPVPGPDAGPAPSNPTTPSAPSEPTTPSAPTTGPGSGSAPPAGDRPKRKRRPTQRRASAAAARATTLCAKARRKGATGKQNAACRRARATARRLAVAT